MGKNKNFNIILIGLIISLFGSAIQRFSFSFYLLDLTGSAAIFSNTMAVSVLPYILFAPLAGTIADTINRKKIMIVLDLLSFSFITVYLVAMKISNEEVLSTTIVMFLLSSVSTFYTPAVTSVIPEVVEEKELIRANGMVSQVGSIANLAGPILAGALYGCLGITGVTILNGISFLLSAVLEFFIQLKDRKSRKVTKKIFSHSINEMWKSYLYLKKEKIEILRFIKSYGMYNICLVPVMSILMPYVIRTQFLISPEVYGVVEGIVGGGMMIGAFLVSSFSNYFPIKTIHRWNYLMAMALLGMCITVIFIQEKFLLTGIWSVFGAIIMMTLGIGNVVTLSYTQRQIEKECLGKISAFSTAVATVTIPIGQIIFGWLLDWQMAAWRVLLMVFLANLAVTQYIKYNERKIIE